MRKRQLTSVGSGGDLWVGFSDWDSYMEFGYLYLVHNKQFMNKTVTVKGAVHINTEEQRDKCLETLNDTIKDMEDDIENLNDYLTQMDLIEVFLKRAKFKKSKLESTSDICGHIDKKYALFEFDRGCIYDCLIFGYFNKEKNTVSIFKERFVYNRYTAITKTLPDVIVIDLPKTFKKYPVITTTDRNITLEKLKKKREEVHKKIDDLKEGISLRESMKDMLLTNFTEEVPA